MNSVDDDGWVEVARYSRISDAEGGALVLAALGIGSRLVRREDEIALFVAGEVALRAEFELAEYNRENLRRSDPPLPSIWAGADGALAYSALLVVFYVADGRHLFGLDWSAAGYAGAGLIVSGDWWRAFTALTLHADLGHLAGNIFAGSVLGMLLAQELGPGLGWLAILLAGGLGNALNAFFEPAAHASIGSSTGIFGALGFLSALTWRRRATRWRRGLRPWVPLAAGVMLLAYLGFGGERTDIGAHIAGFIIGAVGGAAFYFIGWRFPQAPRAQNAYGVTALALIGLSWIIALIAN